MKRHLEYSKKASKFLRITQIVVVAIAANAGTALADSDTYTPSRNGVIGGAAGFAVGAGGTAAYQFREPIGRQLGTLRGKIGRSSPSRMKDAAGRLNRHTNPQFNKKYLDRYGFHHARAVDHAKRKQAEKQAKMKSRQNVKRAAEKRRDSALKKQNRKAARQLKKQRAAGQQWNARRNAATKRKKTLRALGSQTKKHSSNGRRYKKTSSQLVKSKGTLRNAKRFRNAKRYGKVLAGGAAGMVAGAALGERIPDVFDAAEYTAKMARDPRNAPKMLANTARGGVRMAGRMALTVTDPGKMARNLHGAARGVGRSISNTRVYKSLAKTRTGRTIGKGTRWASRTTSRGYKKLARSRTGRAVSSVTRTIDRQVFKRTNKGLRKTGRTISRTSKSVGRFTKKTSRKAGRTAKKIGRGIGKAAKKLKFW